MVSALEQVDLNRDFRKAPNWRVEYLVTLVISEDLLETIGRIVYSQSIVGTVGVRIEFVVS